MTAAERERQLAITSYAAMNSNYGAIEARREWEAELIREKLDRNEKVDTPVCRAERVSA